MTRLALASLVLLLAGCPPRPEVRPVEQPASMTPWLATVEWYEAHTGPEDCPPDALVSDLVQGSIGLEEARLSCLLDLARARELAGVDGQVAAGQLAHERARAESYRGQRWWFLAGGTAAGILVTILLVGLAR